MSKKHLSESVKKGIHRHVYMMMMMGMNKQFVRAVPFRNETSIDERALFLVSFLQWQRYKKDDRMVNVCILLAMSICIIGCKVKR